MPAPRRTRPRLETLEARELPSFGLDTSFGRGGIDLDPFGSQVHFDSVAGLAALPGGGFLAAGNLAGATGSELGDAALARLTSTGTADAHFGTGGLVALHRTGPHAVSAFAALPDGKVLIGGTTSATAAAAGAGNDFFLMRLNADGTPDLTFGKGGEVTIDFGNDDLLSDLAVQADGKIVLAGRTSAALSAADMMPVAKLAMARLDTSGKLDPSFGSGGTLTLANADGSWTTAGLAVRTDGKIIVAGFATPSMSATVGGALAEIAVARFNPDGTLDRSYAGTGIARATYPNFNYVYATSLALLPDGTAVVGGGSSYGQGLLVWFKPDGTLRSFELLGMDMKGLRWVKQVRALPKGGVEALGFSYDVPGVVLEYHAAPGLLADRIELMTGSGSPLSQVLALQADGKPVLATVTVGGTPGIERSPSLLSLARFADPGVTGSPATFTQGLVSQFNGSAAVTLQALVTPMVGPADLGDLTITFREGTKVLGTAAQTAEGLKASWPTLNITLDQGDHTITAEFAGNARWGASSYTYHVIVATPVVTVSLSAASTSVSAGESVTLRTSVSATIAGRPAVPWGTVTVYDGKQATYGSTVYGDGPVTIPLGPLPAGTHTLTVVFSGGLADKPVTSAPVTVTVRPAVTSVELAVGAVTKGVTNLKATVHGVAGGEVTFYDGSAPLGTGVIGADGTAALDRVALRPGTHLLTAALSAGPTAARSAVQRVAVGLAPTAVALSLPATATVGTPVVLSATVSALAVGFPIGSVTFWDGDVLLGTARVNGNGVAALKLPSLAAGKHHIRVVYSGCSTCLGSAAAADLTIRGLE
jgi:uncharacterized delta-60 repeat protein